MATVTPTPNGPLKIEGANLLDMNGSPLKEGEPMFLCRCGYSANKPFCDNSHSVKEFKAE